MAVVVVVVVMLVLLLLVPRMLLLCARLPTRGRPPRLLLCRSGRVCSCPDARPVQRCGGRLRRRRRRRSCCCACCAGRWPGRQLVIILVSKGSLRVVLLLVSATWRRLRQLSARQVRHLVAMPPAALLLLIHIHRHPAELHRPLLSQQRGRLLLVLLGTSWTDNATALLRGRLALLVSCCGTSRHGWLRCGIPHRQQVFVSQHCRYGREGGSEGGRE